MEKCSGKRLMLMRGRSWLLLFLKADAWLLVAWFHLIAAVWGLTAQLSVSITWELVRPAESQTLTKTCWIWICSVTISTGSINDRMARYGYTEFSFLRYEASTPLLSALLGELVLKVGFSLLTFTERKRARVNQKILWITFFPQCPPLPFLNYVQWAVKWEDPGRKEQTHSNP